MSIRIHFTTATVKDLAARWRVALVAGQAPLIRRLTALQQVAQGQSVPDVAAFLEVGVSTVYGWVRDFLLAGAASLVYQRSPGRPPKLTGPQKARLRELLLAGPEAAGYLTGAWNSPIVQDLIAREWGITFNFHYLSALLQGLGFSYQKARFVSDHLDEAKRQAWLQTTWPAIVAEAQRTGALWLFGDEASFAQWGSLGYTWAPQGEQPVVKTTGRRKGYKVLGLVDWFSARLFYRGQTGRFTAASYTAFLAGVLEQTTGPIILVQDGARYHTAKDTQAWFAAHSARVRVYQLPTYSPEYNPIEHVWRYVKEGTHCAYFATFAALIERVEARLKGLQGNADRVQQLLGTPLDDFIGTDLPLAA